MKAFDDAVAGFRKLHPNITVKLVKGQDVAIGFQRRFAALLGVTPADVRLGHVGLNHLTWERTVRVGGEDMLPELLSSHADAFAADIGLPPALLRRLRAVPSYYLRYFYEHDAVVAEQSAAPSRAEEVAAIEERLLRMYADPSLTDKPALLERRGGAYYSEAAIDLLASLTADRGDVQVLNVRNGDRLPFLPTEAVIEVPARVTAAGAAPLPVDPVEPRYAGLIAHVSACEELAVEAALKGGVDRVSDALLAHPLIGQASVADDLARRLVAANAAHLPWAVGS